MRDDAHSVSRESWADVTAMAAFYVDAVPVSTRLRWSSSGALESLGLKADMVGAGCDPSCGARVIQAVDLNLGHLNLLRREYITSGSGGERQNLRGTRP